MASISVISLSSSHSGPSSSAVTVVSISSESQRCPVTWESRVKTKPPIVGLESTPNHTRKVQEWITSLEYPDVPNCNASHTTCIRYDFEKPRSAAKGTKSCYTRATPLASYMEEAKRSKLARPRARSLERAKVNGSLHKGPNSTTPLSPESQKRELCSYLQLMKPGDSRKEFLVEQRRSGRVKTMNQQKISEEKRKDVTNIPTLKSLEDLSLKIDSLQRLIQTTSNHLSNKYMPLPPERIYNKPEDFEDCMGEIVAERKAIGCIRKPVQNRRKFKLRRRPRAKLKSATVKKINLRSRGRLRSRPLDSLVLRAKARKSLLQRQSKSHKEPRTVPGCEIVLVTPTSDDENIDLKNFVDDMLQLDKMSAEHRKSVIESRILASTSITNLVNKSATREGDVQKAYKIFSDLSNERRNLDEKENVQGVKTLVKGPIVTEHSYAREVAEVEEEEEDEDDKETETEVRKETNSSHDQLEGEDSDATSLSPVPIPDLQALPVNTSAEAKSLHRSLSTLRHKLNANNYWNSASKSEAKTVNHSISIGTKNGAIIKAVYQDYNLVVVQQKAVSFWAQSALGNVLGAQNMWIPKGQAQRIPLNSTYIPKNALEMVITTETSVAYVELWTKEHKSDIREVPVADVFATVYFWRLRQSGLDKKSLQLENIKGCADDVQYSVLRYYPKIIVSWRWVQGNEKKTKINSFHLAADFQTVASISEMQPVEHYVVSLHNIEDCDSLIMGCGEDKLTLWNVEYGYIVATVELSNIKTTLSTLWVKCDRGFLFTVQECVDQELRLMAINGMNHSWKKLQNYTPPTGFNSVKGVYVENGVLIAYYPQGILCWNTQTGKMIIEEVPNECEYIPSGKHVIMTVNDKVIVRHSLSHLITADDF